jgi:hypothetical protein
VVIVKINRHPTAKQLRQFGIVSFVFLCGIATVILWRGSPGVATGLWLFALAVVAVAFFAPARLRPLFLLLSYVALPIGMIVGYLSLALVYFMVITPIGLVLRRTGHDAISKKPDASATSYWLRRSKPSDSKGYYRQF